MNEQLEDLLEKARTHAESVVVGKGQQLPPTWLVLVRDKPEVDIFATAWQNEIERQMAKIFMVAKFVALGVDAYSFCSEAWMATQDVQEGETMDEAMDRSRLGGVKDRPDKREVVIAFARNKEGNLFCAWDIVRDERTGKAVGIMDPHTAEGFEGWMTRLPLACEVEAEAKRIQALKKVRGD
jgi:hypothetical protein